ncbi:hypothetical protein E2C01_026887 [Portunus trituberculatus]|uniref:Uncharacterized protein n=1 Tax=Portunus trituberculatus TaxID=210409 RepID=A0A5B7EM95_PORTR|nr:hypothetical protein [Portunus trituberculatus]
MIEAAHKRYLSLPFPDTHTLYNSARNHASKVAAEYDPLATAEIFRQNSARRSDIGPRNSASIFETFATKASGTGPNPTTPQENFSCLHQPAIASGHWPLNTDTSVH